MLLIKNLDVSIGNNLILNNFNIKIGLGEVHAIMGPNGSGKSTFSSILTGYGKYKVFKNKLIFKNFNLLSFSPEERAVKGIFLAFQYPIEIPGVSNKIFLKNSINSIRKYRNQSLLNQFDLINLIKSKIKLLNMPVDLLNRFINVGFSGGEKKRNDILQMMILEPDLCILDETDSGLDIDSLKIICNCINLLRNNKRSFIIITHYKRIFNYIKPNYIHILNKGNIIKSGNFCLVDKIEEQGYGWIKK